MFVPLTPLRCLNRAVDLFGDRVGVVSGDRQFTYREFGDRVGRLATALKKIGILAGDRVAYLSFNTNQLLEAYYGVVQARAIVMPLNVRLSLHELATILNHSGARMLAFENDFVPLVEKLRTMCGGIEFFMTLDAEKPACADLVYEDFLATGEPERADIGSVDENSVAELFYTSGSTGTPKGVMLTHRTLYLHAIDMAVLLEHRRDVVDLHTIPLFHANGWGRPQVSTMMGWKQVMVRRFDPAFVLGLTQQHQATYMCLVPTMANALINHPGIKDYDVSSLKQIILGGAASSPELIDRLEQAMGCECICGYGLTETAPLLTTSRWKEGVDYSVKPERLRRQAMAGWASPGVEVRVVDGEMNDVARDMEAIGEVVARGDHVMEGYYREAEATRAVMEGGWFHTGDMAVWDEHSQIHIVDRKKEIIISGGENISSIEVEKAIFSHPAVFECAVVAAPDERWGEVPAAIVVLKQDAALTAEELIEYLSTRLGRFKMPRLIEFSSEPLVKTGTGKIKKIVLREKYWTGKEKRVQG